MNDIGLIVDSVMSLSLEEERRQYGESKNSNFVEIFKGTNLVSTDLVLVWVILIVSDVSSSLLLSLCSLSFRVIP